MPTDPTPPNTLPCPFCGYNDVRIDIDRTKFGAFGRATCEICGVVVSGIGVMVPEDGGPADELTASALAAWNSRSAPKGDGE